MTLNKKIVLGIISTIFLGGIGNGAWEYIIRPLFSFSSEFGLNLISFGVQKFKNQIYLEIAKNLHEDVSMSILALLTAALLSLIITSILFIFTRKYVREYIHKKMGEETTKEKKYFYYKIFIIFYSIFAISFFCGDLARTKYINRSITKYNQLLTIITPYTQEDTVAKIKSSFALIKNKSDYDNILKNLIQIAEENNIDTSNIK